MMRCHPDQITREVRTFLNTLKEHGADRDDAVYAASAMLVALGERAEQDGYHDIGNEGTEFGRDAIERSSNAEELEAFMIAWITAFRERLTAFHTRITENDRMQRVVSYLREHISDPIGLNDVAEHVEMNPSAFSRWFRETHGSTFVDVCTHLRIDHAARMLLTTSSRIVDIAAMSGYPNARYFAAVFRRVVGVSPSEYRRNALESTNPNNSQEL
jgi:YesN/AraC family two-component response regulator